MSETDPSQLTILRGSPTRLKDHMEQFQLGYLQAVIAAAGCVIAGKPAIDEGVDIEITHRSAEHLRDGVARLEIQMKATSYALNGEGSLSVQMSKDRYDYFACPDPTMAKIIVILSMPIDQAGWLRSTPEALFLHHCAYWVNLAGKPLAAATQPTVSALSSQIFDDVRLCEIMQRIGQGGPP